MEANFNIPPKNELKMVANLIFHRKNLAGYEGGEMMSLDEEISSLQKENNHSDSQLHRIKADVTGMETEASSEDKVSVGIMEAENRGLCLNKDKTILLFQESAEIKRRNAKLSDYYENLRTNVFSILGE